VYVPGVAHSWSDIVGEWNARDLRADLARADSIAAIVTRGLEAMFVHGSAIKPELEQHRNLVAAAIASPPPPSEALLQLASAVCLYEVVGLSVSERPYERITPHLAAVPTSRDAESIHVHWNKALIGLALDEPSAYRGVLALASDTDHTFVPGQTFGFNVWGTIRHFVAARAARAFKNDFTGAWREFLQNYPTHVETRSANLETVLWMGRFVMHHMDAPMKLHEVGDLFPVLVKWAAKP
jgi:hypothetical protein